MTVTMIKVPRGWRLVEPGEEPCGHCKGCGFLVAPGLRLCGPCAALARGEKFNDWADERRGRRYDRWDIAHDLGLKKLPPAWTTTSRNVPVTQAMIATAMAAARAVA